MTENEVKEIQQFHDDSLYQKFIIRFKEKDLESVMNYIGSGLNEFCLALSFIHESTSSNISVSDSNFIFKIFQKIVHSFGSAGMISIEKFDFSNLFNQVVKMKNENMKKQLESCLNEINCNKIKNYIPQFLAVYQKVSEDKSISFSHKKLSKLFDEFFLSIKETIEFYNKSDLSEDSNQLLLSGIQTLSERIQIHNEQLNFLEKNLVEENFDFLTKIKSLLEEKKDKATNLKEQNSSQNSLRSLPDDQPLKNRIIFFKNE